jgi:hypothetical protein
MKTVLEPQNIQQDPSPALVTLSTKAQAENMERSMPTAIDTRATWCSLLSEIQLRVLEYTELLTPW